LSPFPSNWRSSISLDKFLESKGIIGIQGVDTRALTRHIRDYGEQVGIISTVDTDHQSLISKADGQSGLEGKDLVKEVSCQKAYSWEEAEVIINTAIGSTREQPEHNKQYKIVVYDCGVKYNILRKLRNHNCDVTVVPASTSAKEVLSIEPDGVVVSNGPGDPAAVPYMVENITGIIGKKPVMGICLGIQIIAQALGYKTFRLKFGHHGGNQPVMDLRTKKV
ncbi:MAG: carbamoyl phosphate synthase small subunit, partial [Gammaproteobacteria bacterium]|nr:carbamoyl phosphate synthase small subunit [Gammaproteobacteria bacterium]